MKLSMRGVDMNHRTAAIPVSEKRRSGAPDVAVCQGAHPVDRHVGQQIRIYRIQTNISQGDLGAGIGVSFQQVRKYENGTNRVSASMLYQVAQCLKVPIAAFFDGLPDTDDMQAEPIATEVDARIAYIATAEGRRLVEDVMGMPPRLRSRVVSLVTVLVDEEIQRFLTGDRERSE